MKPKRDKERSEEAWLRYSRSAAFKREAHRQSLAVARSPQEKEDQDWIEAISE